MYYLGFAFFYLLSLLPFWLLYRISDVAAWVLCNVVGYRRKTIESNIRQGFPEFTTEQVLQTKRKFYVNFVDNWVETIKMLSMSKATLAKRAQGNYEVVAELQKTGKPVLAITGHFFNWEFVNLAMGAFQPMPMICVYMPISDKSMDRMFKYLRARFGSHLMAAPLLNREIIPWRKKQYVIGLVSDQNPSNPSNAQWLQFLNRPTPFLTGPERNAQVFNQIPVFTSVRKLKRGHYYFHFELLETKEDSRKDPGAITRQIVQRLEDNIRKEPDSYLWSHRRWKHQWKNEYAPLWVDTKNLMPVEETQG